MQEKPLISIIVPVYNVEKYLDRCIKSILQQTFKNFELILVDDGSTDSSSIICDEYSKKDSRVIVIHKKNEGAGIARNIGLDVAKGQFIGFVDSDDCIHKDMYCILYNLLIENNADISICNYNTFTNEISEDKQFTNKIKLFNNIQSMNNYLLDYNDPNRVMHTVVWDKLYKKSLFDKIKFPNVRVSEDGYVVYKLLYYSHKTVYSEKVLYYYLQRENGISKTKFSNKTLEVYDDWREIFNFIYLNIKELSPIAAKFYINKHLRTYKDLMMNKKTILNYNYYKKSIKKDLREDLSKFIEVKVNKNLIFKIIVLNLSFKVFTIIEKIEYIYRCIIIKAKLLLGVNPN